MTSAVFHVALAII